MAVRYNANGEYLQQTSITNLVNYNSSYTLMLWYYPVSIHATVNLGFMWLSNAGITTYDVIGQESVSNGSQMYIGDNVSGFDYAADATPTGEWQHIAMVRYSSTLLRGFRNGIQFGTDRTGNVSARGTATRTWVGNPSGSYYLDARFCYAKLWSAPLTPAEIQLEMKSVEPATNLPFLAAWWPLTANLRRADYGKNNLDWSENGTLSDEADLELAWRIAPPRPLFWWIPPPTASGIIPLVMHHRRQQGIS